MRDKKLKKPKILLTAPLFFISLEGYLAMMAGYFAAEFFAPRLKSIIFRIGNYKVHLHHWLIGLGILPIIVTYKFFPLPLPVCSGFLGGLIFQGIFSYPDWYQVIIRIDNHR